MGSASLWQTGGRFAGRHGEFLGRFHEVGRSFQLHFPPVLHLKQHDADKVCRRQGERGNEVSFQDGRQGTKRWSDLSHHHHRTRIYERGKRWSKFCRTPGIARLDRANQDARNIAFLSICPDFVNPFRSGTGKLRPAGRIRPTTVCRPARGRYRHFT